MRIISKFQDYYDSIQKMYQYDHVGPTSEVKSVTSDNRPWIRKKKEYSAKHMREQGVPSLGIELISTNRIRGNWNDWNGGEISSVAIGFCGKIYPAIVFSWSYSLKSKKEYCYSIADVDRAVEKLFEAKIITKKKYEEYFGKKKKEKHTWPFHDLCPKFNRQEIKKAFEEANKDRDRYEKLFIKEKAPVFSYKREYYDCILTYNDCLKDYQFYRVFDAMAAYQEIGMYFGNMCFPEPQINPVPDEIKAESHGFNKYSFRKDPEKKK